MTADEVKQRLGLIPHPREGGFYRRTYESSERIAATAFSDARYASARLTGTAIYYLLEHGTFSEMHRLCSDEIFHFYAGDAVEMLQLHPGGRGEILRIGSRLEQGQRPQVLAPRKVWQGCHLVPGGSWALLGCTVSPGFEFDDYDSGSRAVLCEGWPDYSQLICTLTHP